MTEGLALFSQNNERRAYDDASYQVWEWDRLNGGKAGSSGLRKKRQSETLVNIVKKNKEGRQRYHLRICLTFLRSKVCSK